MYSKRDTCDKVVVTKRKEILAIPPRNWTGKIYPVLVCLLLKDGIIESFFFLTECFSLGIVLFPAANMVTFFKVV
jgi:hypothetical protein